MELMKTWTVILYGDEDYGCDGRFAITVAAQNSRLAFHKACREVSKNTGGEIKPNEFVNMGVMAGDITVLWH